MSYNLVRLLHLFYLRLRLQLKNLLPCAFQTKILLLFGGTKYCIIFSYLQQFSFFDFRPGSTFLAFFDIFLPNNAIFSEKIVQNWRFFPKICLSHTILQNAQKSTYTTPNPTLWDRRLPSWCESHWHCYRPSGII